MEEFPLLCGECEDKPACFRSPGLKDVFCPGCTTTLANDPKNSSAEFFPLLPIPLLCLAIQYCLRLPEASPPIVVIDPDAFGIIKKVLANIVSTPDAARFRSVSTRNALFAKAVAVPLIRELLYACGFQFVDSTTDPTAPPSVSLPLSLPPTGCAAAAAAIDAAPTADLDNCSLPLLSAAVLRSPLLATVSSSAHTPLASLTAWLGAARAAATVAIVPVAVARGGRAATVVQAVKAAASSNATAAPQLQQASPASGWAAELRALPSLLLPPATPPLSPESGGVGGRMVDDGADGDGATAAAAAVAAFAGSVARARPRVALVGVLAAAAALGVVENDAAVAAWRAARVSARGVAAGGTTVGPPVGAMHDGGDRMQHGDGDAPMSNSSAAAATAAATPAASATSASVPAGATNTSATSATPTSINATLRHLLGRGVHRLSDDPARAARDVAVQISLAKSDLVGAAQHIVEAAAAKAGHVVGGVGASAGEDCVVFEWRQAEVSACALRWCNRTTVDKDFPSSPDTLPELRAAYDKLRGAHAKAIAVSLPSVSAAESDAMHGD